MRAVLRFEKDGKVFEVSVELEGVHQRRSGCIARSNSGS